MTEADHPVLSVIVPVYAVEDYLRECLDSILAEAGDRVEVVAVDDHSPDGSGAILDEYAARDPRVRVIHLSANVGLGRARNAGLEHATGGYVWFVDSDDWLPPGTLPAVWERLAATRPDLLLIDHVEVAVDGAVRSTSSGPVLRSVASSAGTDLPVTLAQRPDLLRVNLVSSACTKVIRRGLLDELDLRFATGWYEDCSFAYPALLAAARIDALDRVSYCYRRRPDGAITGSVGDRHFDVFDQYDLVWDRMDRAAPTYDSLRPELFRIMIDHLLVIAGNEQRLPAGRRREFFGRIADEYRRRLPAGGYPRPGGAARLKHRLVRADAYPAYAALRLAWRVAGRLRARPDRRPGGSASAPQPADLVAR